jgi:hypothetical protein
MELANIAAERSLMKIYKGKANKTAAAAAAYASHHLTEHMCFNVAAATLQAQALDKTNFKYCGPSVSQLFMALISCKQAPSAMPDVAGI